MQRVSQHGKEIAFGSLLGRRGQHAQLQMESGIWLRLYEEMGEDRDHFLILRSRDGARVLSIW